MSVGHTDTVDFLFFMSASINNSSPYIPLLKLASKLLKGSDKRLFMAEVSEALCNGNARLTESTFGFGRNAVALGINEKRTGLICYCNYELCGKQKSEVTLANLESDIRSLVKPESQADSRLTNTFVYTCIIAKAMRKKLIEEKTGRTSYFLKSEQLAIS